MHHHRGHLALHCVISGGSATLTITVPSPGPHDLWVYERDGGGNDSGATNAAPAGSHRHVHRRG